MCIAVVRSQGGGSVVVSALFMIDLLSVGIAVVRSQGGGSVVVCALFMIDPIVCGYCCCPFSGRWFCCC